MVGLIPLFAVETLEPELLEQLPDFTARLRLVPRLPARSRRRWCRAGTSRAAGERRLLSLLRGHRMKRAAAPHARRERVPVATTASARSRSIHARPAVSSSSVGGSGSCGRLSSRASRDSGLFGGNSNWRGPIWFPVNYLLIESLQQFHHYYGDDFTVECPTGSGQYHDARRGRRRAVAPPDRASSCATTTGGGRSSATDRQLQNDPHLRDHVLFHEYFHGDTGRGLGASHQTGWTGLVALLLADLARDAAQAGDGQNWRSRPNDSGRRRRRPLERRKNCRNRMAYCAPVDAEKAP